MTSTFTRKTPYVSFVIVGLNVRPFHFSSNLVPSLFVRTVLFAKFLCFPEVRTLDEKEFSALLYFETKRSVLSSANNKFLLAYHWTRENSSCSNPVSPVSISFDDFRIEIRSRGETRSFFVLASRRVASATFLLTHERATDALPTRFFVLDHADQFRE